MKTFLMFFLAGVTAHAGNVSESYRTVYSTTPVDSSTYVEIVNSIAKPTKSLSVFDSSGVTMIMAIGPSGAEVDQAFIPPGGVDLPLAISSGKRVSIRAASSTASSGENDMTFSY